MVQGISPSGLVSPLTQPPTLDLAAVQARPVRTEPIVPDRLRDPGAVLDAVRDAQARQRAAQTPVGTLANLREGGVTEWLTMTAKLMQTGPANPRPSLAQAPPTVPLPDLEPVSFEPIDRLAGRTPRL